MNFRIEILNLENIVGLIELNVSHSIVAYFLDKLAAEVLIAFITPM